MKLLHVDSSARRSSVSRQLSSIFVEKWREENPTGEVVRRDLAATMLPVITDEWVQATYGNSLSLTAEQRQATAPSDAFIEELNSADTIVIGAPMHNFTVSWPLKAWIDHIVRLGRTVVYSATGPKGLLHGKKVVVITTRGGRYKPGYEFDFLEPYLRGVLGFIGLTDITFIHADNQGGELATQARAVAFARIRQVVVQHGPNQGAQNN